MKKIVSVLSACALLCAVTAGASAAGDDITVLVNSTPVKFDQPPVIQEGRTLVPMRAIFEAMGCNVDWEAASQKVTATDSAKTITMNINSVNMRVTDENGVNLITLDVPPQIIGGRTLVPVRAISEALGANVGWNGDTRTVSVSSVAYLKNLPANDGRRAGAVKGNMTIENQTIKLAVDKAKAASDAEAVSFIEYDLGGTYATLAADISGTQNTFFRVFADGKQVYDSGKGFSKGGLPVSIAVDIGKCKKLRLEAYGKAGTPSGLIQIDAARVIG